MSIKALHEKLSFTDGDLFLNGTKIFTVPAQNHTQHNIRVIGTFGETEKGNYSLFVGTGDCCHGHLYRLEKYSQHDMPIIENIFTPDLNVSDMLAVRISCEAAGFPNDDAILVCGGGCAGAGVRLMSTYYPRSVVIVAEKEYYTAGPQNSNWVTFFRVDYEHRTIYLDLMKAGFRVKPGHQRDPNLPSVLIDCRDEEFYVSKDTYGSIDLGPKLTELGADMAKLCDKQRPFIRIHR